VDGSGFMLLSLQSHCKLHSLVLDINTSSNRRHRMTTESDLHHQGISQVSGL